MTRRPLTLASALAACLLFGGPGPASAEENVMLVLDASGSMWGRIDGRSKVEIAREAVAGLLADWNPDNSLGLVAYGHRRRGDCNDIEVLVEPGPLDKAAFLRTVNGLNALGMTPLSAAVLRAAEELRHTERKATVILVSDGEENCSLDPCAVGTQLAAQGIDFTAHVIGFDVADPAHQAQLRCLAENTGGRYLTAMNAAELAGSLNALVAASTEAALPAAEATLIAPDRAVEASLLTVGYQGPADRGDAIELIDAQGRSRSYVWVPEGQAEGQVELSLPGGVGPHVLRYTSLLRQPGELARQPIELTEAEAVLDAPESVPQGSRVTIRARGPVEGGSWVGIAEAGSPPRAYLNYFSVSAAEMEQVLPAPSEPGDYEIRYVLGGGERIAASRPLRVSPAEIMVSGPDEIGAGTNFEAEATGPAGEGHWVALAQAGSGDEEYLIWQGLDQGSGRVSLRAPIEPGNYELRYVLGNPNRVAARQSVRVVSVAVSFEAPGEVRAGQMLQFRAQGPVGDGNYLTLVPADAADGHYEAWQGTHAGGDYALQAPETSGDYELRFMSSEGRILGRQRVRVLP